MSICLGCACRDAPRACRAACGIRTDKASRDAGTIFLFDQSKISRLRSINRPRNDLGINLPGVAVVLDLVERLRALEYAHPEVTFASGAMWSLWNAFLYARRP